MEENNYHFVEGIVAEKKKVLELMPKCYRESGPCEMSVVNCTGCMRESFYNILRHIKVQ